jgi:hypothetical protein
MMMVNVDINISEEIELAPRRVKKAVSDSMHEIGDRLVTKSKEYIDSDDKNGRVYRVKIRRSIVNHQSSAPGESPANMTGKLKKSVRYTYSGSRNLYFKAGNSKVRYARALELGDPLRKLAKRPYMIKAIDSLRNTNYNIIADNINKVVL